MEYSRTSVVEDKFVDQWKRWEDLTELDTQVVQKLAEVASFTRADKLTK